MKGKWVALSLAAAGLLMASSVFDAADARRGGGHGGGSHARGGGGGHAIGMRSMSMGSRRVGVYAGGNALRGNIYSAPRGRHHAHRHHRHRFVGVPLGLYAGYGYYNYYNSYGGDCEWMRQQALYTGSVYWWDRYYACTRDYGY